MDERLVLFKQVRWRKRDNLAHSRTRLIMLMSRQTQYFKTTTQLSILVNISLPPSK